MKQAIKMLKKEEEEEELDDSARWLVVESYFGVDVKRQLVRCQLESFDYFVEHQMAKTVTMFNPVVVHSVDPRAPKMDISISFTNVQLNRPQIHENNGATTLMFPSEARLRDFTYSAPIYVDMNVKYTVYVDGATEEPRVLHRVFPKVHFGKLPIMVRSAYCSLTHYETLSANSMGECESDCGGYFIIKGSEKVILCQEKASDNVIVCQGISKTAANSKFLATAGVRSTASDVCMSARQVMVCLLSKQNALGHPLVIQAPRMKADTYISIVVLFRAYGVTTDKEICDHIGLGQNEKNWVSYFGASIMDAQHATTQEEAIECLSSIVKVMYSPNSTREQYLIMRRKAVEDMLSNEILPHCSTVQEKCYFLGEMVRRLFRAYYVDKEYHDRDTFSFKTVEAAGFLLNTLFRSDINKLVKDLSSGVTKEIINGVWRAKQNYIDIINESNLYKLVKPSIIENGFKRRLASGDFGSRAGKSSKVGVAQVLNRLNSSGSTLSHLRRISAAGTSDKNGKLVAPRKLHASTWGFICPPETPEGPSVGIIKSLSVMAFTTLPANMHSVLFYLKELVIPLSSLSSPSLVGNAVKVFVNGCWIGIPSIDARDLYLRLKSLKLSGTINIFTSIVFDIGHLEIRVNTAGGRLVRPLLRIDETTGKLVLTAAMVRELAAKKVTWDDLCLHATFSATAIEYVDVDEQSFLLIANFPKEVQGNKPHQYTHCEIHPSSILGVLAACIPFSDRNQSPRNTYQSAMSKQAIGESSSVPRMDKTAYDLIDPQVPLVGTRYSSMFGIEKAPPGCNLNVAIMSYTGYNQEDSLLANQGSIDRGMMDVMVSRTEKDEGKQTTGTDETRCIPNPHTTRGLKFADYSKLTSNGVIGINEQVPNRTVIIGKVLPIKSNSGTAGKGTTSVDVGVFKHEDISIMHRTSEIPTVSGVYDGKNGDGYNLVKIMMSVPRKATIGDKFSSRHGQKGTVGQIVPEADMPYTSDGTRMDLIINPHAIPSRMTIGHLIEAFLGKVLVDLGLRGDGTAFSGLSVDEVSDMLAAMGNESYGNELVYSGITGKQMECAVFMGPTFYQRLKHMVIDKHHSRAYGPMVSLTRQPSEGRSRDGGLRIGEMEKDCIMSHGMSRFAVGRMYYESDKYHLYTCPNCGMTCAYNKKMSIYHCRSCNNRTNFSRVNIPYACKLMFQELITMNVVPRMITQNVQN